MTEFDSPFFGETELIRGHDAITGSPLAFEVGELFFTPMVAVYGRGPEVFCMFDDEVVAQVLERWDELSAASRDGGPGLATDIGLELHVGPGTSGPAVLVAKTRQRAGHAAPVAISRDLWRLLADRCSGLGLGPPRAPRRQRRGRPRRPRQRR